MIRLRKHAQTIALIVISLTVIYLCLGSIIQDGFPSNHDRNLYMNWLYEFDLGIQEGNIQPRWAPDVWIGYGAPIFNFIQPGFYYLAEIFHLIGFNLVNSVKAVIILSVLLGYIGMFYLSRQLWKNSWAALASAALYIWSHYHLGSLYLRGSYAELLAMGLWPFLLIALTRFLTVPVMKYFIILACLTGALLLTNNALAVMFIPVAVGYTCLLAWRHWRRIFTALLAIVLGGGLAAFFWLPAIVEMRQANFSLYFSGTLDYANNFLNIKQLVVGDWTEYIFLIGLTSLTVVIAAVYTVLEKPESRKTWGAIIWWWLVIFFLSLFMTNPASKFIWDHISILRDFQFPWRWLALASLAVGMLGGIFVMYKKSVHRYLAPGALVILIITATLILNSSYAIPESTLPALSDADYRPFREREAEIQEALRIRQSDAKVYFFSEIPNIFANTVVIDRLRERMTAALAKYKTVALAQPEATIQNIEKFEIAQGEATIGSQTIKASYYRVRVDAKNDSTLRINTLWFPGWQVTLDGQKKQPVITKDLGVMELNIPAGTHEVGARFGLTPIRTVGRWITITSMAALLALAIFWKRVSGLVTKRHVRLLSANSIDK